MEIIAGFWWLWLALFIYFTACLVGLSIHSMQADVVSKEKVIRARISAAVAATSGVLLVIAVFFGN